MIVKRAEAERRVPSIKKAPKWKKWFLLSANGTKNLGGYRLKSEAVQREREVQFFKHRKKNPQEIGNPKPFGEREHNWNEVLIQKGNKRRTRKQILDYYLENEEKIWPYLKGQTVMVILGVGKNDFVLRRKGPDGKYIKLTKLKGIDDPSSYEYWINRRVIEFHPVISGKTTPLVWIDVDPYRTKSKAMNRRMQRRIHDAVPLMKSILRKEFKASPIRVWRSGKQDGGWHVEGNLPRAVNVDKVRTRLRAALDEEFANDRHFVTTIAKPDEIRLDTTLLKTTGSLRAPYSYTVDGEQKLPANAHENPIMLNPPLAHLELERFKAAATLGPDEVDTFRMRYTPDVLGEGVGRVAFLIEGEDGWEVIKVDKAENPGQTRSEIECLLGQDHPLMLKMIDYDEDNFRWIHIERVDAFHQRDAGEAARFKKAFYDYSGIKWSKFDKATNGRQILLNGRVKGNLMQELGINQRSRDFLNELFEAMEHCDVMVHEVGIFENWGLDKDGQLKILDMGQ